MWYLFPVVEVHHHSTGEFCLYKVLSGLFQIQLWYYVSVQINQGCASFFDVIVANLCEIVFLFFL